MRHRSRQQSCHDLCSFLRGVALGARPGAPSAPAFASAANRSVHKSPAPPGAACAARMPRERGAPVRPAPARHASTALRSVPASRARPGVTGGDPAAPGRLPATPQPPHEPRQSLRLVPWRRVGASAHFVRPAAPVAFAPCGRVRLARRSRCPRARPGKPGVRCARSPKPRLDRPTVRAEDASTDGAATLQLVPASASAAPTVPALRAPGTPARKPLRSLRSLRVADAPCGHGSRSAFRSFVAALRSRTARRTRVARVAVARRLTRRA